MHGQVHAYQKSSHFLSSRLRNKPIQLCQSRSISQTDVLATIQLDTLVKYLRKIFLYNLKLIIQVLGFN